MRIKDEDAKSIDKLVASILTMLHEWQEQKGQPQPQEHIHKHSFDIKSSKPKFTTHLCLIVTVTILSSFFLWALCPTNFILFEW